jgi:hypothetical protein
MVMSSVEAKLKCSHCQIPTKFIKIYIPELETTKSRSNIKDFCTSLNWQKMEKVLMYLAIK